MLKFNKSFFFLFYKRQRNVANLILPSEGSPERVSRLNVKSIPSCWSSACGLRQISPGSDSQRGGGGLGGGAEDGRAHLKSFEYRKRIDADTLKSALKERGKKR